MIKSIRYISMGIVLVIIGAFFILQLVTTYVPVGKVGVRLQEYSFLGSRGVVKTDFGPGWHRDLGPIDSWVFFDSTVQTLEMTRVSSHGSRSGRDDVQLQSADGYAVSVDVTIKYRILDGQAHQLFQDTGGGTKYQTIVRNESQQACMELFGRMRTEDLYDPEQRRIKATEVHERLKSTLSDNFIEVIDVLIRDVQFDPEYEKKIQMKKLADQEVELNKSMAKAAEMKGKTEVIEAETIKLVDIIKKEQEAEIIRMQAQTDLEIATILAEADRYATEKQADADALAKEKRAEGDLLIKQAEAKGEELRNQAMLGVGGSTLVALEAARNLKLKEATVSTVDTDFLDLDAMIEKFGAAEKKERAHQKSIPLFQPE